MIAKWHCLAAMRALMGCLASEPIDGDDTGKRKLLKCDACRHSWRYARRQIGVAGPPFTVSAEYQRPFNVLLFKRLCIKLGDVAAMANGEILPHIIAAYMNRTRSNEFGARRISG